METYRRHAARRSRDRALHQAVFDLANCLQGTAVPIFAGQAASDDRGELVALQQAIQRCSDVLKRLQPTAGR